MTLQEWALKWNIPPQAINDLAWSALHVVPAEKAKPRSEAWVQSAVRLEAENMGIRMWRNNKGAGFLSEREGGPASFMRFGLANDNKKVSDACASADLIGIRPVRITLEHVGCALGQFVSRECKEEGWQWTGDEREQAQLAWRNIISACGGDAQIVNGRGSFTP